MPKLSSVSFAAALCFVAAPSAAQGQKAELPDGAGKQSVEAVCTACHNPNQILHSSGYTQCGLEGAALDHDRPVGQAGAGHDHRLSCRALPAQRPPARPSCSRATQRWRSRNGRYRRWASARAIPSRRRTARSGGPDNGAISIGRIDPTTGEMKEYPLPPDSLPHTVTLDAAGNVWYTGNGNGTVGKLDPKTAKITVYTMPDPAARTRIRRSSTVAERCGSPSSTATWWAASSRPRATSSW